MDPYIIVRAVTSIAVADGEDIYVVLAGSPGKVVGLTADVTVEVKFDRVLFRHGNQFSVVGKVLTVSRNDIKFDKVEV